MIDNYLLETTRVVHQNTNERSFHIFYQLLSNKEARLKYHLEDIDSYNYVNHSGCTVVPGVNDAKEFEETKKSMEVIGLSQEEQENVFATVAAILHLGNVKITSDSKDLAEITDKKGK
jgi:myosin heavy subunit